MSSAPLPTAAGPGRSGPPERFGSCSRVLFAPPETGPGEPAIGDAVEEIAYRRCPVGLIAALDCPELAGLRCRHHDPRGVRPKAVVPRSEVAMLARELADSGYLTEAYRRRLRGLRVAVASPRPLPFDAMAATASNAGPDAGPEVAAPRRRASVVVDHMRLPVNVPSDDARRRERARRRAAEKPAGSGGAP